MKSGFVTLAGKPNVGKSTLINALFGRKVVIVSDKPQTTRNRIRCILTGKDFQIVFVDTPGIHKPLHKLGEYMVKIAVKALEGVDLILVVLDAVRGVGKPEEYVADFVNKVQTPVMVAINKIDVSDARAIEMLKKKASELFTNIVEIVPVSALTGENLDVLLEKIVENLEEGPQYYPEDMVLDRPLEFMISELIREKIFLLTHQEVPHSSGVVIEQMEERDNGVLFISATIYVERDSQKAILIGKKGSMIKEIGTLARKDIEYLVGNRVFLELRVKTNPKWRNKDGMILSTLGFKHDLK